VDYALFIGEERTLAYKRFQGIVLNEPSIVATSPEGRVLAVGQSCEKLDTDGAHPNISYSRIVRRGMIYNVDNATIFLHQIFKKLGKMQSCIVCIPSSLDKDALDEYKSAIYSAHTGDVAFVFIPSVFANATEHEYNVQSYEPILSTVVDGDFADLAVIKSGEIIDGGTLDSLNKFEEAKNRLMRAHPRATHVHGDRQSIINGAGKMLGMNDVIKKIITLN